jgi:hypothetical protein
MKAERVYITKWAITYYVLVDVLLAIPLNSQRRLRHVLPVCFHAFAAFRFLRISFNVDSLFALLTLLLQEGQV